MSTPCEPYREMKLHDDFIDEEIYSEFIAQMPQLCVEIVLETDSGILLADRNNYPEVWFWPGGRLYKGEQLEDAAHRIAQEELGIEIRILDQFGPYTHFWNNRSVKTSPTRHTVNSVFHAEPANTEYSIELDDQHSDFTFIQENEADLHEYVQRYIEENDLL